MVIYFLLTGTSYNCARVWMYGLGINSSSLFSIIPHHESAIAFDGAAPLSIVAAEDAVRRCKSDA